MSRTVGLLLAHKGAWSTRGAGPAPQGDESHAELPGDDVGSADIYLTAC